MKQSRWIASTVAFFPIMVAVNWLLFNYLLKISYIDWYITKGPLFSIAASLFAIVWKDLDKNEKLISANPTIFLGANLNLVGTHAQVIGYILMNSGDRLRSHKSLKLYNGSAIYKEIFARIAEIFDGFATLLVSLLILLALTVWFFSMVPLQYFVILIAGAPARLALKLREPDTTTDSGKEHSPEKIKGFDEYLKNCLSSPVSFANAVAALLLFTLNLFINIG